jgi:hypothetical protein
VTADDFVAALAGLEDIDDGAFPVERRLEIAGCALRIRLSSPRLAERALRALAHHDARPETRPETRPEAPPEARSEARRNEARSTPELTIFVGDHDAPANPLAARAGAPGNPRAADLAAASDRIERFSYDGRAGRGLLHEGFRALFLRAREGNRAALWLGETARFPYHLATSPLLPILAWFLAGRGRSVVHAGAVVTAAGAVLLAGRSGTGKSTASLACLADGLDLLGDDMCVIEQAGAPIVHSLFCSAKIEVADIGRFPTLLAALAPDVHADTEKAVFLFDRYGAERIRRSAPIAAIAFPVRGSDAAPQRISVKEAFLAMAPNTVFQMPGIGRDAAAGVKALVSAVPAYRVGVGHSIAEIAPRIRAFADLLPPTRDAGAADRDASRCPTP